MKIKLSAVIPINRNKTISVKRNNAIKYNQFYIFHVTVISQIIIIIVVIII